MAETTAMRPALTEEEKESFRSFGARLAELRKERGFTQIELAEKIGLVQTLVSDYERGKLRLNVEMLTRFALALQVSADQILGLDQKARSAGKPQARRILRRLQALEKLPKRDREALLRTIDAFLAKAS